MSDYINLEPMHDMYVFETAQLIEQLEQIILDSEKNNGVESQINEIFRIMHTIKGSSAMMCFNNLSVLAHSVEDVFFHLREKKPKNVNYIHLTDIILKVIDFIGNELQKIKNREEAKSDPSEITQSLSEFLNNVKTDSEDIECHIANTQCISPDQDKLPGQYSYKAIMTFEDDCEMESLRAFGVIHMLQQVASDISHRPEDLSDSDRCNEEIRSTGFEICFSCGIPEKEIRQLLEETMFLKELTIECESAQISSISPEEASVLLSENFEKLPAKLIEDIENADKSSNPTKHNFISVNIIKMNKLMDVVGELVISEAMVTQNPDLKGLELENFSKSSRHLRKITRELQDIVMAMRMVPLSGTFQRMNRIVRDMSKKLNKEVELEIIGEETEVDKNIIEHISDPLIHLLRNAIDHGIESKEERILKSKAEKGKIILEARNSGGDVWITLKDDGRGLDREKILKKAIENKLLQKPADDMSDREIYSLIMLPGFSTKEEVTEFSGRGVGMDVVVKNIDKVSGAVHIDSAQDQGSTISIKIPLTLAIMDGMIVKVGKSTCTIPTISIRESLKISRDNVIMDPDNNEMALIRGNCYPVFRLHNLLNTYTDTEILEEGILILVESEGESACIFADRLIGEQQVVVKALPQYIKKVQGISGCTLLGDGNISLIIDIASLINKSSERRQAWLQ